MSEEKSKAERILNAIFVWVILFVTICLGGWILAATAHAFLKSAGAG